MRRRCVFALALSALGAWTHAGATLTASVDRDHLSDGESLQLRLQSDGSGSAEPDLAPLANDFDVVGRSSSRSVQVINGAVSSQRQLILTLLPKHAGQVVVPPLHWDGDTSAAIGLQVAAAGAAGAAPGSSAHVFLTTTLDTTQPYVQAAVTLTVQLHSDESLHEASLDLAGNNDVRVQQLGEDQPSEEMRNGHRYQIVQRRYILLPQRSGPLKLDGPVLNAQVADGNNALDPLIGRVFGQLSLPAGMSATRPLRLRADPITLAVRPRPPQWHDSDWLPAQQVTLDEDWQPADATVAAGQPVTRHLRLTAVGLSAAQLPDLGAQMPLPAGLKAYPDQAKLDDQAQSGRIVGRREQAVALLADHPGHYELPAWHLRWWDTLANAPRERVLPARALTVLPAAGPAGTAPTAGAASAATAVPPAAQAAAPPRSATPSQAAAAAPLGPAAPASPWRWISLLLGLLWLGTLGAFGWQRWRAKRSQASVTERPEAGRAPSRSAALRAGLRACAEHDAPAARSALLAWARAWASTQGSGPPPAGLNALARQLGDPRLTPLLRELDQACLGGTAWHGQALASALRSLPAETPAPPAGPRLLPRLYGEPAQ
jgi:hypothetical protein